MGYWGSYHYFNLRQDYRSALIQVYECTGKYPIVGVSIFPTVFFEQTDDSFYQIYIQLREKESQLEKLKAMKREYLSSSFYLAKKLMENDDNKFSLEKGVISAFFITKSFTEIESHKHRSFYESGKLDKNIQELEFEIKSLEAKIASQCQQRKRDLENLAI